LGFRVPAAKNASVDPFRLNPPATSRLPEGQDGVVVVAD
jgi:hypothetical protein